MTRRKYPSVTHAPQPDVPNIPGIAEGTLERFNFGNSTQRRQAETLRLHEVPFIVYNVPEVDRTVQKWTVSSVADVERPMTAPQQEYITGKFGAAKMGVTCSKTNHFMARHWMMRVAA